MNAQTAPINRLDGGRSDARGASLECQRGCPPAHTAIRKIAPLALLLLAGCTALRMPESIAKRGGLYQPWTQAHTAHRDSVLACLGMRNERVRPSLWIAPLRLMHDGREVIAYYDPKARAIVFSPIITVDTYWSVFRHEVIHATGVRGHEGPFRRADECGFR